MKRLFVPLLATTTVMLAMGLGGVVYAQGGGAGARAGGVSAAAITGQGKGDCRMAFSTDSDTLGYFPDNTLSDNPASTAILNKTCVGPVEARFTAETVTPESSFIALVMRATCTFAGTSPNPCTVGTSVFAEPGVLDQVYLTCRGGGCTGTGDEGGTHGMNMIFPSLQSGKWKIEALLGSDTSGTAAVFFRTLTVEAFTAAA